MEKKSLENITKEKIPSKKKIAIVDTLGNVTYSLIVGGALDYWSGLDLKGIAGSRASATAMNSFTGGAYGWWREKFFNWTKTKPEHNKIRKTAVDLLAFNTFQIPIYGTGVAIGSLFQDGYVDLEKVIDGMEHLATISPLIGPTMGLYMDGFRKLFGIKPAVNGAYKKIKEL